MILDIHVKFKNSHMLSNQNGKTKICMISWILVFGSISIALYLFVTDYLNNFSFFNEINSLQNAKSILSNQIASKNHQKVIKFPDIEFSSEFETGNLQEAIQISKYHYSLQIGLDPAGVSNSIDRRRNWFHFKIHTTFKKPKSVKLTIHHLEKNWSIWTHGCGLAYKSSLKTNDEWRILNTTDLKLIMKARGLVLEFVYNFETDEETSFAITFPYSYTELNNFITRTQNEFHNNNVFFFKETLIFSNLGHNIELLTLTNKGNMTRFYIPGLKHFFPLRKTTGDKSITTPLFSKSKKVYIISARVHPAESASSFMLEGLINYFKIDTPEVNDFLDKNVIYIIPMLNPDGVTSGFTRCDANGYNLNEKYREADLNTPSIYALKKFIRYMNHRGEVKLYLDLHSHFTKRGFFIYGNPLTQRRYKKILEFPFILKKKMKYFSLRSSKFGSAKHDESTSRKDLFLYTKLKGIYTIEANYWGGSSNKMELKANKLIQNNLRKVIDFNNFYTPKIFRSFGEKIAKGMIGLHQGCGDDDFSKRQNLGNKIEKYWQKLSSKINRNAQTKSNAAKTNITKTF